MKIGVVGAGSVGVGVCSYLITLGSVRELVLFNRTLSRAEGEILDFSHTHALTFSKNTKLVATNNYEDLRDADIVAITAGANIQVGEDRLALAEINSKLGVEIAKEVEKVAPNAILIVVSNPVDIMSYFIAANTGFDPRKIISAGCVVDTARLMSIVAKRVRVDPKNVFGYIVGEHGTNCFSPKSLISIAGQPIDYYCANHNLDPIDPHELLNAVKQAGYEIMARKNNTTHGVSASVFRIIQAISINEHSVLPVGTMLHGEYGLHDVTLSLPSVIDANGVKTVLTHPFTEMEVETLHGISDRLKAVIQSVSNKTGLNMYGAPSTRSEAGVLSLNNDAFNDSASLNFDDKSSNAMLHDQAAMISNNGMSGPIAVKQNSARYITTSINTKNRILDSSPTTIEEKKTSNATLKSYLRKVSKNTKFISNSKGRGGIVMIGGCSLAAACYGLENRS